MGTYDEQALIGDEFNPTHTLDGMNRDIKRMKRMNCWEYKQCGREFGGARVEELGACPASLPCEFGETNNGEFGGRICWALSGTLCEGKSGGTSAQKLVTCLECEFLKSVQIEESRHFVLTPLHHSEISQKEMREIISASVEHLDSRRDNSKHS